MLEATIRLSGYEVEAAPDGDAGLTLQRKHAFDVVVTDIVMPKKEGIETILELNREFPEVKVVAISGGGRGSSSSYLQIASSIGADICFEKPINLDELLRAIDQLIQTRPA